MYLGGCLFLRIMVDSICNGLGGTPLGDDFAIRPIEMIKLFSRTQRHKFDNRAYCDRIENKFDYRAAAANGCRKHRAFVVTMLVYSCNCFNCFFTIYASPHKSLSRVNCRGTGKQYCLKHRIKFKARIH